MDKYKKLIIRYEKARSAVKDLALKRSELLGSCANIDEVEYPQGLGMYQETRQTCLFIAFQNLLEVNDENIGEEYSYSEVLDEMRGEDNVCDACYESYKIKKGSLADARKEFGNAKRALSHAGKRLLKDEL